MLECTVYLGTAPYARLKEILEAGLPADMPLQLLPGNHDRRGPLTAAFSSAAGPRQLLAAGGDQPWAVRSSPCPPYLFVLKRITNVIYMRA